MARRSKGSPGSYPAFPDKVTKSEGGNLPDPERFTVSSLIKRLEELKRQGYGDLPIKISATEDDGTHGHSAWPISAEEVMEKPLTHDCVVCHQKLPVLHYVEIS